MLSKIDITFIADWKPLINKFCRYSRLSELKPDNEKYINGYKANRYDFGNAGSYTDFATVADVAGTAGSITGSLVESNLIWHNKMKQDMKDLNLISFGFQGNFGSLKPHVDGQESATTVNHCKLNYIIDNYDATTYVQDNGITLKYPSVKDTAWLLDTTKLHWVTCNEQRYVFQLSFHQSYDTVLRWFNDRPGLVYS